MQNTLAAMNKDTIAPPLAHPPRHTLGSPHWLPCHEVEGKRSAFFNFPSVDTSLPQINSPENVKYARDSFGHWPRTGNEHGNYRCELFVTGSDLFKRRQAMHIRRDKPINLKEV